MDKLLEEVALSPSERSALQEHKKILKKRLRGKTKIRNLRKRAIDERDLREKASRENREKREESARMLNSRVQTAPKAVDIEAPKMHEEALYNIHNEDPKLLEKLSSGLDDKITNLIKLKRQFPSRKKKEQMERSLNLNEEYITKIASMDKELAAMEVGSDEKLALSKVRKNMKRRMKDETRRRIRWNWAMGYQTGAMKEARRGKEKKLERKKAKKMRKLHARGGKSGFNDGV